MKYSFSTSSALLLGLALLDGPLGTAFANPIVNRSPQSQDQADQSGYAPVNRFPQGVQSGPVPPNRLPEENQDSADPSGYDPVNRIPQYPNQGDQSSYAPKYGHPKSGKTPGTYAPNYGYPQPEDTPASSSVAPSASAKPKCPKKNNQQPPPNPQVNPETPPETSQKNSLDDTNGGLDPSDGSPPLPRTRRGAEDNDDLRTNEIPQENGTKTDPGNQAGGAGTANSPAGTSTPPPNSGISTAGDQWSENPEDIKDIMLTAHNAYRAEHKANPLEWDSQLAEDSKKWSQQIACQGLTHSQGNNEYGENLAAQSTDPGNPNTPPSGLKPGEAVKLFVEERAQHQFSSNGFNFNTGHFTQVVWKQTTKVGCGAAKCASSGKYTLTCRYTPPGNVQGEFTNNVETKTGS